MTQTAFQQTIGKYHIVETLSKGSTGTIHKAIDPATQATVAIKIATNVVVRDKTMLRRFEQEFRSTSNLVHPNLVRGLEFGWEGPKPYIVFEYFEGESLWTRIERDGRMPEAEAVVLIRQVAEGLHEAHKHGIIHRDIKPDNIQLTNAGQAKIADLGLCKDLEEGADLTRAGHGIGTPNFIAPEQFGDAKHASVRCDIYSLGTTLYMALTGKVPFAGPNISTVMTLKMANELMPARKLVPALSEHVDWTVRRAIQADPARRFASCPEFIAALTGEVSGLADATEGKRRFAPQNSSAKGQHASKDRRAALRFECTLPGSCSVTASLHEDDAGGQTSQSAMSWEAKILSLSISGIGLYLPRRFEPKSVLSIVLTGRGGNATESRQIRVVRVSQADGTGWYLAGAFTKNLSKEELRRLL